MFWLIGNDTFSINIARMGETHWQRLLKMRLGNYLNTTDFLIFVPINWLIHNFMNTIGMWNFTCISLWCNEIGIEESWWNCLITCIIATCICIEYFTKNKALLISCLGPLSLQCIYGVAHLKVSAHNSKPAMYPALTLPIPLPADPAPSHHPLHPTKSFWILCNPILPPYTAPLRPGEQTTNIKHAFCNLLRGQQSSAAAVAAAR